MCQICLRNPCVYGCPNEEEQKVAVCSNCGENICVGEEMTCIDDSYYCESCMSTMTVSDIIDLVGGVVKTAELSDIR